MQSTENTIAKIEIIKDKKMIFASFAGIAFSVILAIINFFI